MSSVIIGLNIVTRTSAVSVIRERGIVITITSESTLSKGMVLRRWNQPIRPSAHAATFLLARVVELPSLPIIWSSVQSFL